MNAGVVARAVGRRRGEWERQGFVVDGPAPATDPEGEACTLVRVERPDVASADVRVYDWGGAWVSFTGSAAWEPPVADPDALDRVLDHAFRRLRAISARTERERAPVVAQARAAWERGEALEAGMLLFESLAPRARPGWAGNLLLLCCERAEHVPPAVAELIAIARDERRWGEACDAFHRLRAHTLLRETPLLDVAENVAKVTCNAAGGRFDHNAGWRLVAAVHRLAAADPGLLEDAWQAAAATG